MKMMSLGTKTLGQISMTAALLLLGLGTNAQELEPRRWAHIPGGVNFFGVGYALTDADIYLDPVLLIEDAEAEIHTLGVSFIHVFELFGKTSRIDMSVPFSSGRWEGLLDGQQASTERDGLGDPKIRLAINLLGPPAQSGDDFRPFTSGTIVGASLEIAAPLGEYDELKLINLGNNRWSIRPQIGVTHSWNKWTAEISTSAWFFSENKDFRGDLTLEQDPLYAVQTHLIHTFRPGLWASASIAYGSGARSTVLSVPQDNRQENLLWALSLGYPIDRRQGLKFVYVNGTTKRDIGNDIHRFQIAYSIMWGGR
jgi:hypothetical protein